MTDQAWKLAMHALGVVKLLGLMPKLAALLTSTGELSTG